MWLIFGIGNFFNESNVEVWRFNCFSYSVIEEICEVFKYGIILFYVSSVVIRNTDINICLP